MKTTRRAVKKEVDQRVHKRGAEVQKRRRKMESRRSRKMTKIRMFPRMEKMTKAERKKTKLT